MNRQFFKMTSTETNRKFSNTITGKCGDGLCRIRFMGDTIEIVQIDPEKGVSGAYSILIVPSKSVTVSITGSEISVRCHYDNYKTAGGIGEMTYKSGEMDLDLSDKEIEDGYDLNRDEERERLMTTLEMRRLFGARDVLYGSLTVYPDIVIWG